MTDLRISVTDRCNFRCTFCMPAEQKYRFAARRHILTFEEVTRLASIFTRLGVEKIRLTGGEPLLRAEVEKLVGSLKGLPGVRDLALTTNAYLLAEKADALVDAGLDRVTVSLHSLDPDTFSRVNGLGLPLERVLGGIRGAVEKGLTPVKLNVVVMKDVNDHEIVELQRVGGEGLARVDLDELGPRRGSQRASVDPRGVDQQGARVEGGDGCLEVQAARDLGRVHGVAVGRERGAQLRDAGVVGPRGAADEDVAPKAEHVAAVERAGRLDPRERRPVDCLELDVHGAPWTTRPPTIVKSTPASSHSFGSVSNRIRCISPRSAPRRRDRSKGSSPQRSS